ncbi:MAG: hypothetical protein ACRERV_13735 [Methylococcales bacterium]
MTPHNWLNDLFMGGALLTPLLGGKDTASFSSKTILCTKPHQEMTTVA